MAFKTFLWLSSFITIHVLINISTSFNTWYDVPAKYTQKIAVLLYKTAQALTFQIRMSFLWRISDDSVSSVIKTLSNIKQLKFSLWLQGKWCLFINNLQPNWQNPSPWVIWKSHQSKIIPSDGILCNIGSEYSLGLCGRNCKANI